jgi:glucosamine-6-phosphate deaminase
MIKTHFFKDKVDSAAAAALLGAQRIQEAIIQHGKANIVVATGASQFEMLEALTALEGIDWSRVTGFHLDEYVGMSETSDASFRRYLKDRFVSKLPELGAFHFVNGDAPDIDAELCRLNALLDQHPIDVTFAGIGENGHLAFNDPPADFETTVAYRIVDLDEKCRLQQFGEGWFSSVDAVPRQAISMTVQRIMASGTVIVTVPDVRKAKAVRDVLEGPVINVVPASILQDHLSCHIFLDSGSASSLSREKPAGV